jgi:hypothetical protein
VGIPEHEVPLSLLMFNLGVETGQILVTPSRATWRLDAWKVAPYAIGGLAAFWTIQRIVAMIPAGV